MDNIMERLEKVFKIVFNNETLTISLETCADDIEGWDSLQHLNLLAMIEKEFGIQFDIDDIVMMEKVADIIECIKMRQNDWR